VFVKATFKVSEPRLKVFSASFSVKEYIFVNDAINITLILTLTPEILGLAVSLPLSS
jgi:hypothetical protein